MSPPTANARRAIPRSPVADQAHRGSRLTVIVPAYNEAASIGDTIRSLQEQTLPPEEIVVVDDCSTGETADVARSLGVTVVRPPTNTGTKAGAQNFALKGVVTELTMVAIDADTTGAPDAIERLLGALSTIPRWPRPAGSCSPVACEASGSEVATSSTCSRSRSTRRSRTTTTSR